MAADGMAADDFEPVVQTGNATRPGGESIDVAARHLVLDLELGIDHFVVAGLAVAGRLAGAGPGGLP
jgi:hypothetical protein